jgi:hypothetical protein
VQLPHCWAGSCQYSFKTFSVGRAQSHTSCCRSVSKQLSCVQRVPAALCPGILHTGLACSPAALREHRAGCFVLHTLPDNLQAACTAFHVHVPGKYPEFLPTACRVTSLIAVCFTVARCWTACGHIHAYALHSLRCFIQSQREQTRLHMMWSAVKAEAAPDGQGRHEQGPQETAPQGSQGSGQSPAAMTEPQQQQDNSQQPGQHTRLQGHQHQQTAGGGTSGVPLLLQRCGALMWAPVAWVLKGSLQVAVIAGLGVLHVVLGVLYVLMVLTAAGSAVWRCCSGCAAVIAAACTPVPYSAHRCLSGMGSRLRRSVGSSSASQDQGISSSGHSTGSKDPVLTSRVSGGGGKQGGRKQAKRGSLSKRPSKSDQDGQQQQTQTPQQQDWGSAGSQQGPGVSRSQSLTREGPSPCVLRPSTSGGARSEAAAGSHNQRPDHSLPGTSEPESLRPAAGAAQASPLAALRSTLSQALNLPARLLTQPSAVVQQEMGSNAQTGSGASHGKGRKRQKGGRSPAAGSSANHDVRTPYRDGLAPAPAPASSPVRHDPDRGSCLICLERLVTHRGFLHANSVHTCFCAECAESIMAMPGALCPVCRVPIDSMVIIY